MHKNLFFLLGLLLVSCAPLPLSKLYQTGKASWYGSQFHGKKTASGEIFDMNALTAAHPHLPFGSFVLVQSRTTGKRVQVRINDRGPFAKDRIIDLSYAAARALGFTEKGSDEVDIYKSSRALY